MSSGPLRLPFRMAPGERVEVGNNFANYQRYPGWGVYAHGGIDLRVAAGTPVIAIRGGRVELRGLSNSTGAGACAYVFEPKGRGATPTRHWAYDHLDPASIPAAVRAAARQGTPVRAGTTLGRVMAWPVVDTTDGKPFDHLHLDLLEKPGRGRGTAVDVRARLGIPDRTAPTVSAVYVVAHGRGTVFPGEPACVRGRVDVIVDGFDRGSALVAEPGGGWSERPSPFRLGISKTETTVRRAADGVIVHRATMDAFSAWAARSWEPEWQLQRFAAAQAQYRNSIVRDGQRLSARGGYEGRRSFLVVTPGAPGEGPAGGGWDTRTSGDGVYVIEVRAQDEFGNTTRRSVRVVVANDSGQGKR